MSNRTIEEQQLDLEEKKYRLKCLTILISLFGISGTILTTTWQLKLTAQLQKEKAELEAMVTVSKILIQTTDPKIIKDKLVPANDLKEQKNVQFVYLFENVLSKKHLKKLIRFDSYSPYKLIAKLDKKENENELCTIINTNKRDNKVPEDQLIKCEEKP